MGASNSKGRSNRQTSVPFQSQYILVAQSPLTYFLKSVLKSPKAAPVLPEVGVLSWAASTAASAPPWSLYETPVDILTARQRVQLLSLHSGLLAINKCQKCVI